MARDMTRGQEGRHILLFALPMLLGNIVQQLYSMVDMIIVGRYVGANALGSMGASMPIQFALIAAVMGLLIGASVLISQLWGAGELENVRRAISTTLIFSFLCALAVTVLGLLLTPALVDMIGTPEVMRTDAVTYLRITFAGIVFMFMYNAYASILRALGDSRTPLYFLVLASVANIVLDLWFVRGLGWGVAGAAWATIISQALSVIGCMLFVEISKHPQLRLGGSRLVFDRVIFRKSIRLGLPSALQQSIVSLGFIFIQGLINSFGEIMAAGMTAASRIEQIATMPAINLGMAVSTFTGQNMGAGKPNRVRWGYYKALGMIAVLTLFTSALILLGGEGMLWFFLDEKDAQVAALGAQYLNVVGYFLILFGLMFTTNGLLRGSGDVLVAALGSLLNLGARVAAGYAFRALGMGPASVWWSLPVGWVVGLLFSQIRYWSGAWQKKGLAGPAMIVRDGD